MTKLQNIQKYQALPLTIRTIQISKTAPMNPAIR
jgi:hypothetical protein